MKLMISRIDTCPSPASPLKRLGTLSPQAAGLSHLAPRSALSRNTATFVPVIPAKRAGLRPASESRNPVIKAVRAFTSAVDYWIPARASPVDGVPADLVGGVPQPGSLGRDDSPYAIALPDGEA